MARRNRLYIEGIPFFISHRGNSIILVILPVRVDCPLSYLNGDLYGQET